MVLEVEKVVKIYKSLSKIPALLNAKYELNGLLINSLWSQRNLDSGKLSKFSVTHLLKQGIEAVAQTKTVDVSQETLTRISPSENFKAVIREVENKDSRKQFLEIWSQENLAHSVDLSALESHEDVYADTEFASLQWSPDETNLLYVAEKKLTKSDPFYKRKTVKKEESSNDTVPPKGEEYVYRSDWGEQLVGKKQSVIVIFSLETENVKILEGIPDNVFPAKVIFAPDGNSVVGIGYKTEPRKLGLLFCTNRPSEVFQLDFNGNYITLSEDGRSVKSPRFTPDGQTLIWLQRSTGGPHHSNMSLVKRKYPFNSSDKIEVVVDFVKKEMIINNDDKFYGLYNTTFPERCWASERRLLLSTNQKNTVKSYVIDIDTRKITELKFEDGSLFVLDVYEDKVLFNHRNALSSDRLVAAQLPKKNQEHTISFNVISKCTNLPNSDQFKVEYLEIEESGSENIKNFTAIYIGPKTGKEKSVPLILWPHGGPHSAFFNFMSMEISLFLMLGYGVLQINYRGSIGAGEDSVNYLPGKIGISDVSDCILSAKTALNKFPWLNPDKLALVGGSHGGFLVLHLSGQYPDMFKVVVARNPVVDVVSMSIISDIPDWSYVEGGGQYTQKGPLSEDEMITMRKLSPIVHAHKVKAPTMLQIGSKDLRVPCSQGIEYYNRLKANGVTARMNLYDDNHPLSQVPNEIDNVINTALWVDKYINPE